MKKEGRLYIVAVLPIASFIPKANLCVAEELWWVQQVQWTAQGQQDDVVIAIIGMFTIFGRSEVVGTSVSTSMRQPAFRVLYSQLVRSQIDHAKDFLSKEILSRASFTSL